MALPVKAKTWQYNVNQTTSGTDTEMCAKNVLFTMVSSMWGFATLPWIHWGSCNGATGTANNNSSTNLWLTAANIVPKSYMVLENPKNGMQVCIYTGSYPVYYGTFVVSLGGQFGSVGSGGTGTDGTTSARPTAGDEIVLYDNAFLENVGGSITFRVHAMHSSDGACTRVVCYRSGVPIIFWIFDEVSNPITGFTLPVAGMRQGSSGTNQCTYSVWNDVANMWGRISGTNFAMHLTCEGVIAGTLGEQLTYADDDTLAWPIMPIGLASLTGLHRGRKGALYDLWWGSTSAGNGNTYPDDTTKVLAQFTHLIFPWNGTTPGIS